MNKWVRRKYQKVALVALMKARVMWLLWARQCRKSTTLGDAAFRSMSEQPGRTVIAASASLLTAAELVSKSVNAAEQAISVTREADAMRAALDQSTNEAGGELKMVCANSETGKVYNRIGADDYRDLYVSKRLEMRLHFDRTSYSRLLIIAPNPATARGWTGHVYRDEAMFTQPEMERDLRIAVKPIMDTDPTFRMIYASNVCPDDRHPAFEETLPAPDADFPVSAGGNFYRGQNGVLIHRVALADAYAAGHVLYDMREGKPMTYEQFCADPANKLGLNQSYLLIHEFGGTAAIDLLSLITAQRRGIGQTFFAFINGEGDMQKALAALRLYLGRGEVGIGIDVATTTKATSNPTSVTVTERSGNEYIQRAVFAWKEKEPKVAWARLRQIFLCVRERGTPAKRACIDATNEQYFARMTAEEFSSMVPFELVDARNKVDPVPEDYERDPIYKTWLGDLYSAAVNGNRYSVPSGDYYKDDQRSVIKTGGLYACEPNPLTGAHGDTFDSGKLAQHALDSGEGGPVSYAPIWAPRRLGLRGKGVLA